MTPTRPRPLDGALNSLLRAILLVNPRRILRHFRSVTHRLNQIAAVVNAEAATRVDRGLEVDENHPFGKDDRVRGSGHCRGDWHEDQGLGFHIALKRKALAGAMAEPASGWHASVA